MINNSVPRAMQLEVSDVCGGNILYPFRIRGIKCPISYLGALINDRTGYREDNDYVITEQGMGFNATTYRLNECFSVDVDGNVIRRDDDSAVPVRIKWKWSEIKDYCCNVERASDGVIEADYGLWFGRTYLEEEYFLENMYHRNMGLEISSIKFSTILGNGDIDESFVFMYDGILYSRLKFVEDSSSFSAVWCRVSPIHLWVDEERDIAISEEAFVIGGNSSEVDDYLIKYFSKEVFAGAQLVREGNSKNKPFKLVKSLYGERYS